MNIYEAMHKLSKDNGQLKAELNEEKSLSWQFCANAPKADDGTFYTTASRYMRVLTPAAGYHMTEDMNEPLESLVNKAMEAAKVVDAAAKATLQAPEGEPWTLTDHDDQWPEIPVSSMKACAESIWSRIRELADNLVECSVNVSCLAKNRKVVNTLGLVRSEHSIHYKVMAVLTVKGSTEMNNCTWRAYVPSLDVVDEIKFAHDAIFQAQSSLDGEELISGSYPVVISASVMSQMMVGFWKIFCGEAIVGKSSFLADKMGKRIACEAFNLADVGFDSRTGLAAGFDDEGTLRDKHYLIEKGIFTTPLTNLEMAAALNIKSSGNAARKDTLGRIIPNALVAAPKITYIVPSEYSLEDLFAKMGNGIYITSIDDIYHAFNTASGDFSTPCRGAFVKDGKLSKGIRLLNLSDNLSHMFENIVAVGNQRVFCDLEDLDAYYMGGTDVLVSEMNLMGNGVNKDRVVR